MKYLETEQTMTGHLMLKPKAEMRNKTKMPRRISDWKMCVTT
jgi:hypothetical protein